MNEMTFRRATFAGIPALSHLRWDMCVEQGVADPEDDETYAAYRDHMIERKLDR